MIRRDDALLFMELDDDEEIPTFLQEGGDSEAAGSKVRPLDSDVLLGKSSLACNHPGNGLYRALVHENRDKYQKTRRNVDKAIIIESVLQEIAQTGGRFLRRNDKQQCWEIVTKGDAYKKVAHALRNRGRQRGQRNRAPSESSRSSKDTMGLKEGDRGPTPLFPALLQNYRSFVPDEEVDPKPIAYGTPLPSFDTQEKHFLRSLFCGMRHKGPASGPDYV